MTKLKTWKSIYIFLFSVHVTKSSCLGHFPCLMSPFYISYFLFQSSICWSCISFFSGLWQYSLRLYSPSPQQLLIFQNTNFKTSAPFFRIPQGATYGFQNNDYNHVYILHTLRPLEIHFLILILTESLNDPSFTILVLPVPIWQSVLGKENCNYKASSRINVDAPGQAKRPSWLE